MSLIELTTGETFIIINDFHQKIDAVSNSTPWHYLKFTPEEINTLKMYKASEHLYLVSFLGKMEKSTGPKPVVGLIQMTGTLPMVVFLKHSTFENIKLFNINSATLLLFGDSNGAAKI
jgi:hypothetical protein